MPRFVFSKLVCDFGRSLPQTHSFCFSYQIILEIGVSDADEQFRSFPHGSSLQVNSAIFCYDIVRACSGNGNGRAFDQSGNDEGFNVTIFISSGGRSAQEGLSAVGFESAQYEVYLSAVSADMLPYVRFGVNLTLNVYLQTAVDGNNIVVGSDNADIIYIVYRHTLYDRIVIQEIIQSLRTLAECMYQLTLVDVLSVACDLAGFIQLQISVYEHFGMNAQILNIGFSQLRTDIVGKSAYTQLCPGEADPNAPAEGESDENSDTNGAETE